MSIDMRPMSRAHRPGRTFYSFPAAVPWEEPEHWWDLSTIRQAVEVPWMPRGMMLMVNPDYIRRPLETLVRAYNALMDRAARDAPVFYYRADAAELAAQPRVVEQARALASDIVDHLDRLYPVDDPIDDLSATDDDHDAVVAELVALAKAGNRADFDFLAGAVGVKEGQRRALWDGTRARLGKS